MGKFILLLIPCRQIKSMMIVIIGFYFFIFLNSKCNGGIIIWKMFPKPYWKWLMSKKTLWIHNLVG